MKSQDAADFAEIDPKISGVNLSDNGAELDRRVGRCPTHTERRRLMTKKMLWILSFVTLIPILSVGCSAQYTYTRAVGSWKSEVAAPEAKTINWADRLRQRLEGSLLSDLELQILPSGEYTVTIRGRQFSGTVRVTDLFGEGLGVATEIGNLEAQGRIRIVDEDHMILEGNGTEISLVRCR